MDLNYKNVPKFGTFFCVPDFGTSFIAEREHMGQENKEILNKNENVIEQFRYKTDKNFHCINDLCAENFEDLVYHYINYYLEEYSPASEIIDVVLSGSRCRGLESNNSDMDFVVEYEGEMDEYEMFNLLNREDYYIMGIKIDINPIRQEETGTLEQYLPTVEKYLEEKAASMQKTKVIEDDIKERFKSVSRLYGYPIIGNGNSVFFPEEYDDVFTKQELTTLSEIVKKTLNNRDKNKVITHVNPKL